MMDYAAEEAASYAPIRRQLHRLNARQRLDPRDPDALDEAEEALLEQLEEWEP